MDNDITAEGVKNAAQHRLKPTMLRSMSQGETTTLSKVILATAMACLTALAVFSPASPQDRPPQPDVVAPVAAGAEPSETANGDHGLHLGVTYYGDLFGDLSGGLQSGSTYQGRFGLILDADLGELAGWTGAIAHLSVHQIHGQGITQDHVGALMAVSGLEAEPATRLFNLWIEQQMSDKASLRIGQFTAGQEFFISANAGLFINSTFGWPAIVSQNLPSGGPAYPLATPGIRFSYRPAAGSAAMVAIFNGDPAGPGGGDPQQRDITGLNGLRLSGRPFVIGEMQQAFGGPKTGDPDLMIRVGAWAYLGDVLDRRSGSQPSPGPPAGAAGPAMLVGDQGLYGIVDKVVLRTASHQVSVFLRVAVSPPDRSLVDRYADGGISLKGPFGARPNDQVGIAIAFARVQAALHVESVIELTYQAQVTGHWSVQPDLQYIIHPSGELVSIGGGPSTNQPVPNAIVVGVRNIFKF